MTINMKLIGINFHLLLKVDYVKKELQNIFKNNSLIAILIFEIIEFFSQY